MPAVIPFIATLKYAEGTGPTGHVNLPANQVQSDASYDPRTGADSHTYFFTLGTASCDNVEYKFNGWDIGAAGSTYKITCTYPNSMAVTKTATAKWLHWVHTYLTVYYYNLDGTSLYNAEYNVDYLGFKGTSQYHTLQGAPSRAYYNRWWATSSGAAVTQIQVSFGNNATHQTEKVYLKESKKNRTLTYNGNAPSGYTVSNVPNKETFWSGNDHVVSSTVPTAKNGSTQKVFYKWNTKADGTGNWYGPGDTLPKSNTTATTLYAIWKYRFLYTYDSYCIPQQNYVRNAAPNGSLTIESLYTSNREDPANDWIIDYYKSGSTVYEVGKTYKITADVTVTPHWKKTEKTYKITYNANLPSNAVGNVSNIPETQTKKYSANLILSNLKPTLDSHIFKNWNTKANGSGVTYNSGGTYSTNKNVTLYAQWDIKRYRVYYYLNGGTGQAPSPTEVEYGKTITNFRSYSGLTKKYFKPIGWNTDKNSANPLTSLGPYNDTYYNTHNALYAVWKRKTVKVQYCQNEMILEEQREIEQGLNYKTAETVSGLIPPADTVLFGWCKVEDSATRLCALGEEITIPDMEDNGAYKLYPFWRSLFDAYYSEYQTTTRGRRIIYQKDYITEGNF